VHEGDDHFTNAPQKTFAARHRGLRIDRLDGNGNGLTAATNDSGVLFLPDGSELAVSVYVKASTRTDSERDRIIVRIGGAAFDYFVNSHRERS